MKTKTQSNTVAISALPKLGENLNDGIFAGLTTMPDGTHCAVILLPEVGTDLTWTKAKAWAKKRDGELPSRPVAALLFTNVKSNLTPAWHWTSDAYDASSAWDCNFIYGYQYGHRKGIECSAVAVRLIPITA